MNATEPADLKARRQALDPCRSFIVQAPAGSGKTGLLVRRFLRLLANVDAPEQVLAITFTRKATAEMRQRIIFALRDLDSDGRPETDREMLDLAAAARARDAAKGWSLVQNPRRLRVQTIDSFCHELVRRMPWSARFGAVPSPRDDASRLYSEAADTTLELVDDRDHAELADACSRVLRLVNASRWQARDLLGGMLKARDRWMRALESHDREQFESWWRQTITDTLIECHGRLDSRWKREMAALARLAALQVQEEENNARPAHIELMNHWIRQQEFPEPEPERMALWRGLAFLLLTGSGSVRSRLSKDIGFPPSDKEAKERMNALLEQVQADPELHRLWQRVAILPDPDISDSEWATTGALLTLLPAAAAHLKVLFNARQLADFTEIAQRADLALGNSAEPSDLTLALDYQLRHILMDEFQDTSSGQIELLEKLLSGWTPGDGRTLFLVGDPMQSIYRFREAEVGIFMDVQDNGIQDVALENLTLRCNFRSAPALVEWFNRSFKRVMPAKRSLIYGAVDYTPAEAFRPADPGAGIGNHAAIQREHAVEAEQVVDLVADTLDRFPGEEIAILGRTRGHLGHIVETLNRRGIPFQGIKLEHLSERQAIQDLVTLTLVLTQPADDTAWFSLLRCPWGGARLTDLVQLAGGDNRLPVFEALHDEVRMAGLPADVRTRFSRVRDTLDQAFRQRARLTLQRNLQACWLRLGGPVVVGGDDLENCRRYIELVGDLEREGTAIHAGSLATAMADLYAESHRETPLKLATIHGAKGLEYDTVILPGLGRGGRGDGSELIRWKRFPDRLLIASRPHSNETSPTYNFLGELEKEHQQNERCRLLYVACTRARRRLYLFGSTGANPKTGEPRAPASSSLLALLWPVLEEEFHRLGPPVAEIGQTTDRDPLPPADQLRRLDPAWRLPDLPAPVESPAAPLDVVEESEPIEFDWARESARIIGIVVHQVLQNVDRTGWNTWSERGFGHADRQFWQSRLTETGLPASQLADAVHQVEATLNQVRRDPIAGWIFSPEHDDIRTEWALSGLHRGKVRQVVLDRSFVDRDGVRWVIDFKSSRHEDEASMEEFLAREKIRYRDIMHSYAAVVHALDSRPARAALYYPRLGRLVEYS